MKILTCSILSIAVLAALPALGALSVVEDFESLTPGGIDMQGLTTDRGNDIEVWNTQSNTSNRRPHNWTTVESGGANSAQCARFVNRDDSDNLNTVYTCMFLGDDHQFWDKGTVYMQYKAEDPNDFCVGLNSLEPGYVSDEYNSNAGDPLYQGTRTYGEQICMWRLEGDAPFHVYDGKAGGYLDIDMGIQANVWNEIWIQVDCINQLIRYYVAKAGEAPQVVINTTDDSEWFGWRNPNGYGVMNIKWLVAHPWNQAPLLEHRVWVDNIAVDTENFTTESLWQSRKPGDANGDGHVNIEDFVILKQNYNATSGKTFDEGDFNGDGAVNIEDFVILKQNYNT